MITNIKGIIYDTLEKDNKFWVPKNHNPSSASFKYSDGRVVGKDLLSLYYKWTGVNPSNPPDVTNILTFKLGDGVHSEIAKILSKAGIKAVSEVSGKINIPGLKNPISYRVDGLHEIENDLEVIEVKSSTYDAMFDWKYASLKICGPKIGHLLQLICYLNLVPGVKRGRLLYVARDTGDMLEYLVENNNDSYVVTTSDSRRTALTEVSFKGIIERWKCLENFLQTQTPPTPEYRVWLNDDGKIYDKQIKGVKHKSDWEAKYSPYRDMIYLDPKNYETATYNALFKAQGKI